MILSFILINLCAHVELTKCTIHLFFWSEHTSLFPAYFTYLGQIGTTLLIRDHVYTSTFLFSVHNIDDRKIALEKVREKLTIFDFFSHPLPVPGEGYLFLFLGIFSLASLGQNLWLFLVDCPREQDVSGRLCLISQDSPGQWLMGVARGRLQFPSRWDHCEVSLSLQSALQHQA